MRTWPWIVRRLLVVASAGLAVALPAVTSGATGASAALMPVVGCGFHFGATSEQGAAGTLFESVVLQPANPAQRCTTAVTFMAHAAPTAASAGPYTDIANNPLTATQTVTFVPGRLPPLLVVSWGGFHCADPPVPGSIRFTSGSQSAAIGITPTTCFGMGHSEFDSAPFPASLGEVGIAPTANDQGYRTVSRNGQMTAEGNASIFVAAATNSGVVGIASPRSGNGAWVAAADGGVFAYGTAGFHGSLGAVHLNQPIVGIAATPSGNGYWLVAADGGVFSFGDAGFHGSLGAVHLNAPIVGMAAAPDGHGYFLTALDGGVFAFGSATFAGSLGNVVLNAPIVGIAAGPHGGYWLSGSDGSVFAFGGVPFKGSLGAFHLPVPVSGMAATASGNGYWLVGTDNRVYAFGDAHFFGDAPATFP
jgi:hypothetical protein